MVQYSRPFFPGGIYGARLNWVQFPPHPTPPPPGGREKQGSLPPGGGGRNKAPSPLVGEGETRLPPPLWGRVGVGGKGKHVQSPRAQYKLPRCQEREERGPKCPKCLFFIFASFFYSSGCSWRLDGPSFTQISK